MFFCRSTVKSSMQMMSTVQFQTRTVHQNGLLADVLLALQLLMKTAHLVVLNQFPLKDHPKRTLTSAMMTPKIFTVMQSLENQSHLAHHKPKVKVVILEVAPLVEKVVVSLTFSPFLVFECLPITSPLHKHWIVDGCPALQDPHDEGDLFKSQLTQMMTPTNLQKWKSILTVRNS